MIFFFLVVFHNVKTSLNMSTDAFHVAREIVHELVADVIQKKSSAISSSDFHEKNDKDTPSGDEILGVDLSVLLFLLSEDHVVSRVSHRDSRAHIHQLRVVRQHHGHYCGHYAFHFALCAMKLCRSADVRVALSTIAQMKCKVSNWTR